MYCRLQIADWVVSSIYNLQSTICNLVGNRTTVWYHAAMLWTISDLHLSSARPKPMDIFGDRWRNHPQRIAAAWRERVRDDDVVLIAGDISWAMKLDEAMPDLEWIAALPGSKVMIRGNHDYWCP